MGSVRDAGQWPGTIAREIAKYRGMNALFNGARSRSRYRARLSPPKVSAAANLHDQEPRTDPLTLASHVLQMSRARCDSLGRLICGAQVVAGEAV
jgi:hypothetical protein